MAFKHVMFPAATRGKVLRGATELADAVGITLGSKGAPLVALENAASVASILLPSEATMTEIAEPKKEQEREAEAALL